MNTNNRNSNNGNNRRRGRNNNRGQGGGGNQGNRIDSRARGNAPQMLEKYRKLAHDASLNGDRVQTEYYLQFADHYFRVIADSRSQKDDQRPTGQRDREQQSSGDDFYDYEEDADSRGRRFDSRRDRDEDGEGETTDEAPRQAEVRSEGEDASADGAEDNPFLRESRPRRPRGRDRERSPRAAGEGQSREGQSRDGQSREAARDNQPREEARPAKAEIADNGFDAGILPPSIARDDAPAAPKRAPRARKPRKTEEGDSETLEVVG